MPMLFPRRQKLHTFLSVLTTTTKLSLYPLSFHNFLIALPISVFTTDPLYFCQRKIKIHSHQTPEILWHATKTSHAAVFTTRFLLIFSNPSHYTSRLNSVKLLVVFMCSFQPLPTPLQKLSCWLQGPTASWLEVPKLKLDSNATSFTNFFWQPPLMKLFLSFSYCSILDSIYHRTGYISHWSSELTENFLKARYYLLFLYKSKSTTIFTDNFICVNIRDWLPTICF